MIDEHIPRPVLSQFWVAYTAVDEVSACNERKINKVGDVGYV